MEMRRTVAPVGVIYELANRDLRLTRIAFPFRDRIGGMIVEFDQAVVHGTKRGDAPKTFRAAEDRPFAVGQSAVRVTFENGAAVLHDQYRNATLALGIFCSARAIGGPQFRRNNCRCCAEKKTSEERCCSHRLSLSMPPELDRSQPAAAAILDADLPASNASAIPRRWVIRRECAGQNDREKIALSRRATAGREFRRGR